MPNTYLITGASSGLGACLGAVALALGNNVIGTARNVAKARTDYPDFEKNGGKWLTLDVSQPECQGIVEEAVQEHNVDVLVNNAGYALRGPLEDLSFDAIRAQWDTNYFGLLACIRGALPSFRAHKRGTIVNITSVAAFRGTAGFSQYTASKFAIEGASEGLALELAPFGIRVLIVEPGGFRTNFQAAGETIEVSEAYKGTAAEERVQFLASLSGKMPGDPVRAAEAIVEVVGKTGRGASEEVGKVLRLPLGKDAVAAALGKAEGLKRNVEVVKAISEGTDFTAVH